MAVFTCKEHPSLFIVGGGAFVDGVLEVDGAKADKVRSVAKSGHFDITEDKPAPASKRGRPAKTEPDE